MVTNWEDQVDGLVGDIETMRKCTIQRKLIAVAGPPASGKTTLAQTLADRLNNCSYLSLDGFHLDNSILIEKGLRNRKGSPETFDVMGLKNFLIRLANEPEVVIPIFDRSLELSRSSAVTITKNKKTIIVEGNYLLLNSYPWSTLKDYFDSSIMIHCEEPILEKRLIERWKGFDLNQDQINQKVYENDLPNGVNVIKNSIKADYYLAN